MKKSYLLYLILLSGLLVVFLSSCSKDDSNNSKASGTYFFRFNANGTKIEFTNQLILTAMFSQSGSIYFSTISGANDATTNIGLQIYHNAPITEGEYSGYGVNDGQVLGVIIGYLEKESGILYSSGGGPDVEATIEITDITNTTVSGIFHGILTDNDDNTMSITQGEFHVKKFQL